MELAEVQRQIMEQTLVDEQCTLLDKEARKALNAKEDLLREQERQRRRLEEKAEMAYKSKEAITRHQMLQRRLKEKEIELAQAALITSFMKEDEGIESSRSSKPLSECEYNPRSSSEVKPSLFHSQGVHGLLHSTPSNHVLPSVSSAVISPPFLTSFTSVQPAYTTTSVIAQSQPTYITMHPPLVIISPASQSAPRPAERVVTSRDAADNTPSNPYPARPLSSRQDTALTDHRATPDTDLMELLVATSYELPRPTLPHFTSGKESDFALLKMALDHLLDTHAHLTEQFKYQVLLDHLKLPSAYKLAQAYMYHPNPYTAALQALQDKYGQSRQLVQSELGAILNSPQVRSGDPEAFDNFALSVQSLVGMLRSLEGQNGYELRCGSHVDRLLSKLPINYRDAFVEYSINRGILRTGTDQTYTLEDLSVWLQLKSQAKRISSRAALMFQDQPKPVKGQRKSQGPSSNVFYNTEIQAKVAHPDSAHSTKSPKGKPSVKPYCPYCDTREHYLSLCPKFKTLTTSEISAWIKDRGCWRCGRTHKPEACTLKKPCQVCKQQHLTVLHEVCSQDAKKVLMVSAAPDTIYIDRPSRPQRVMLKLVKVRLYNAEHSLEANLDDGSERTLILPSAVRHLHLTKEPENLPLRTVRHEVIHLQGASVSFDISPAHSPKQRYHIFHAFTAGELSLSEHRYPVKSLMRRYPHLQGLPLPNVDKVQPLLLIGSDFPHLLLPKQPVRTGPPGSPVAVRTALGWTLQGPANLNPTDEHSHCYFTMSPNSELQRHVERLWEVDINPYANTRTVIRSKEDQQALELLEQRTVKVEVDGVTRYATPLLRRKASLTLWTPKYTLLPQLRSTERRLAKDTALANTYCQEIQKLEQLGYVKPLPSDTVDSSTESWYLPHHVVHHNGKARIVYNCSYQHNGQSLNSQLLPGPTLGPTLLGVLLRFREHSVAISGDIKSMFHQVRLVPEDKPLLRFLWRGMKKEEEPTVYEWQVLPFGTTCSPCCATYALQRHVKDNSSGHEDILHLVETAFYVDNCLTSVTNADEAKTIIDY
ncbi:uncharacterized protein [Misgurnus anguillicaudatus]|uniref:uncharacterized protein n=1 Tax=Misgurnus anguillicaudatus TaxID=75329 RepID=UPI003CCF7A7B